MKKLLLITLLAVSVIGNASADQPNMQNALFHLRAAKTALEEAGHNKGGWRVEAIASVNRAIAETEKGIRFAR